MTFWTPAIDEAGPVYLAIIRALEVDIARGKLAPGDRLPPQRALANELGVNVGTVTRAYGEARRRGLIEGEIGRGTYVRSRERSGLSRAPREESDGPIDLSINVPLPLPSGYLTSALEGLLEREALHPGTLDEAMAYHDPEGSPALRAAGARFLTRLGVPAKADRIVVCSGAQHGILVALGAIAGPGDLVLGESLTYPGFTAAARMLGLRVQGVPMDRDGILPDALEAICQETRARLLYCMPSLQNPTCAVLTAKRREAIAEIADRHDFIIVQDEVQVGIVPDPVVSLSELVPDRVVTIATLSKTLSPGIRTAFVAAPAALIPRLAELVWSSIWMTAPLGAEIALDWLKSERSDAIIRERAKELADRHALAKTTLGDLPFDTQEGASHLWLPLSPPWDSTRATEALAREGVRVSAAEEFQIEGTPEVAAIRVSLTATQNRKRLKAGLEIVRRVLSAPLAPIPRRVLM